MPQRPGTPERDNPGFANPASEIPGAGVPEHVPAAPEPSPEVETKLKSASVEVSREGYFKFDFNPELSASDKCPHGTRHGKNFCSQCVLDCIAGRDIDILSIDVGGAETPNPVSSELACVYSKRTARGGHQVYEYIRKNRLSAEQFCEYLRAHKQNNVSAVELDERTKKITVWSNSLGFWIGTKGRWKQAYIDLDFDVEFRELGSLKREDYADLPERLQDFADREQKVVGEEPVPNSGNNNTYVWGIPKDSPFWAQYKKAQGLSREEVAREKEAVSRQEFERRTQKLQELFDECKVFAEVYREFGLDVTTNRDTLLTYDEALEMKRGGIRSYNWRGAAFKIGGVNEYGPEALVFPLVDYTNSDRDERLGHVDRFVIEMPTACYTLDSFEKMLRSKLALKGVLPAYVRLRADFEEAAARYADYVPDFERGRNRSLSGSSIRLRDDSVEGACLNFQGKDYPCDDSGVELLGKDVETYLRDIAAYAEQKKREKEQRDNPKPVPVASVDSLRSAVEKSPLEIEFEGAVTGKGELYARIIVVKSGTVAEVRNLNGEQEPNAMSFETGSRAALVNGRSVSVFAKSASKMHQYPLPSDGFVLLARNGNSAYVVEMGPPLKVVSKIGESPDGGASNSQLGTPTGATHNPFQALGNWKR